MAGKKKKKSHKQNPIKRLTFPQDEKQQDWLSMLLDAYHIINKGVAEGIRLMERKGHVLACAKGCSACCVTHRSIPVYPIELVGISWFATEKLTGTVREQLKAQLNKHQKGDPCAFLIDGACGIHPMRPMACRQFNVFNKACNPGEDAYYTRRHEVLTPLKKYTQNAFLATMPFYDIKEKAERKRVVKEELMHAVAKDLQTMNWDKLAAKMFQYEMRHPELFSENK